MAYQLSIEVFGLGEDINHRSHWGFTIHRPPATFGDLLHVRLIDLGKLWYQFEYRSATNLSTMQAVGLCKIATLNDEQRRKAIDIIQKEKAPTDGKRKCQDWVFDTLIALEIEELVPDGTADRWHGLIGKTAKQVKQASGSNWTGFTNI